MFKTFREDFRSRYLFPLVGFLVVFILVILLTGFFAGNLINQSNQKFDNKVESISDVVNDNFNNYVSFLIDIQGFFAGSDNVERSEFTEFMNNINFQERYPGITAIGFSRKVLNEDKQAFMDTLNNDPMINPDGTNIRKVNPDSDIPVHFLLDYLEPYTPQTNFGFDSASSSDRLPNIMKAIDTYSAIMTDRVALTGANQGQFGFSIYIPIYQKGSATDTVENREKNSIGVLIAAFRLNNVFSKIFQNEDFKDISLKIFTNGTQDENLKLFDSNVQVNDDNPSFLSNAIIRLIQPGPFTNSRSLTIASREWNLNYKANVGYGLSETERFVPRATLVVGIILSILAGVFIYYLRSSEYRALALAEEVKIKLKQSEARVNDILESVDIIAYAIDAKGIFTLSLGKGLADLGLKPHELEGKSVFEVYKDNPVVVDQIKRALGGEIIQENVTVGETTLESRITPILNENNKVVSIAGISHNITRREEAEAKIKEKNNELERLNKVMINRELKMKELKDRLASNNLPTE